MCLAQGSLHPVAGFCITPGLDTSQHIELRLVILPIHLFLYIFHDLFLVIRLMYRIVLLPTLFFFLILLSSFHILESWMYLDPH